MAKAKEATTTVTSGLSGGRSALGATPVGGKNALAKTGGNAVSTYDPAYDDFASGPTGLENVTANDILIPRLVVLQTTSFQLQRLKPEYITNAKAGQFCDTGLGELFDDELFVIPCFYAKIYLEWSPNVGKGLQKNHGLDGALMAQTIRKDDDGRNFLPNGNILAETATFFSLYFPPGSTHPRTAFLPLASTQLRAARAWLGKITAERLPRPDGTEFQPPIFFRSWRASVKQQANEKGQWFTWDFSPGPNLIELDNTRNLLRRAVDFCEQAAKGLVRGDITEDDIRGNERAPADNDGRM